MFHKVLVVEDRLEHFQFLKDALVSFNADLEIDHAKNLSVGMDMISDRYDLFVLDLELPDGSGVEMIPKIRSLSCNSKIMVNTVFEDDEIFFKAMRLGIDGYILKTATEDSLITSLMEVDQGMAALSPLLARKLMNFHANEVSQVQRLTEKERGVLKLIAQGHTMKSAAEELNRSVDTVKYHIKEIYKKTGAENRSSLLKIAQELGVL